MSIGYLKELFNSHWLLSKACVEFESSGGLEAPFLDVYKIRVSLLNASTLTPIRPKSPIRASSMFGQVIVDSIGAMIFDKF